MVGVVFQLPQRVQTVDSPFVSSTQLLLVTLLAFSILHAGVRLELLGRLHGMADGYGTETNEADLFNQL